MSSPSEFQTLESAALPVEHKYSTVTPPGLCAPPEFDYGQNQPSYPFYPNFPSYPQNPMYPMNGMGLMTPQQYALPSMYGMPGASSTVFSTPESLSSSTLSTDLSQSSPPEAFNNSVPAPSDNSGITVTVGKIWEEFDAVGNEMILTRNGRNPFPKFHLNISDLNPNEYYKVALSFNRSDDQRYKFNEGRMESCGVGEPIQPSEKVFHPDAINSGVHWMQNPVKFDKIKVSNNESKDPSKPCVKLLSMHKYHAVAHIYRIDRYNPSLPPHMNTETLIASVAVPHTTFVTVTAYQNQKISELKIQNNNYARGFRSDGKHTRKRNNEVDDEPTAKRNHNESNDSGLSLSPQMPQVPQAMPWAVNQAVMGSQPFFPMYPPPYNTYPPMWQQPM